MLDQRLAEAMQRVLAKRDERASLNATLQRLVNDFDIGTVRGKSVYFTAKDRDEMRALLKARGYSMEQVSLTDLARAERLALTPNEKAGGGAVKRSRISIKALPGRALRIGGEGLSLPPECHLDANSTLIEQSIAHPCVLVIENYENFNRVHEIVFDLPAPYEDALVIYRGDPQESRLDNVQALLERLTLPVLAFPDADPAGLAQAASLPRFEGIVLPSIEVLTVQLRDPRMARMDLFYDQIPVYSSVLDALACGHPCRNAWRLLQETKSGITQERWIGNGTCVVLHPSGPACV